MHSCARARATVLLLGAMFRKQISNKVHQKIYLDWRTKTNNVNFAIPKPNKTQMKKILNAKVVFVQAPKLDCCAAKRTNSCHSQQRSPLPSKDHLYSTKTNQSLSPTNESLLYTKCMSWQLRLMASKHVTYQQHEQGSFFHDSSYRIEKNEEMTQGNAWK